MRSDWVPFSAGALVTGAMALILGQMLNPAGSAESPAAQLVVAADSPGRWLAMSILYFFGSVALILGMPAVVTLFTGKGRVAGLTGIAVFSLGCMGVAAISSLMLMFRALAISAVQGNGGVDTNIALITGSLENPELQVMLGIWIYGFLTGVLLVAFGLFRARVTPAWVPSLLLIFLVIQTVGQTTGTGGTVLSQIGLLCLAAGFTGIATTATSPDLRDDAAGTAA